MNTNADQPEKKADASSTDATPSAEDQAATPAGESEAKTTEAKSDPEAAVETPAEVEAEAKSEAVAEPAGETEADAKAAVEPKAEAEPAAKTEAGAPAESSDAPAAEVVMEKPSEESTEAVASTTDVPAAASKDESESDAAQAAEQAAAVASDDRLETKLKAGQRVEVKLVQVGEKDAMVDFGGTAEGVIATSELKNAEGELRVNEGETFTAIVRKVDEPVEFTVGRGKGGDLLRLRELQSAHEGSIPVEGRIKSTNKGGFEVDLKGVRAFCPFSQIDTIYCENPEEHVGNTYTFEIIAFERGGRNIVLSRRRLIEEEAKASAGKTRENLAIGQEFEGLVRRLQPYGAFVDIGGVDGLVHVSEISRGHVADPRDVLKVGGTVRVKVIGIDDLGGKRERISLSIKELEADPWEGADEQWAAGAVVKGKVVRLTEFGAFVELAPGVDGLVHISEISTERIGHPSEVLAPDQEVEARILQVDPGSHRISLTLRPEGEDRPARPARDESRGGGGGGGGGGGRGRRPRYEDNKPAESYTFGDEETKKEPDVDVENLDFTDAVELLKRKFKQ